MKNKSRAYIAGIGMITSVGFDLKSTHAAVKAGISGYKESEYYNKNGKPFTMSLVPGGALPDITYKLWKEKGTTIQMGVMLQTIDIALKQAMQNYPGGKEIPVFFSGPESYLKGPYSVSPSFIDYIIKQTKVKIDKKSSRMFATGRAGVIEAVDFAMRYMVQTDAEYVLVGGADSFQEEDLLEFLDQDDRIVSEQIMNGFVPGEASCFLLLTLDINKAKKQNSGVVSLYEPGLAKEKGHMYSEEAYLGDGLSLAFKQALQNSDDIKVSKIYSSLNGEKFWAKEYGVAVTRTKDFFKDDFQVEHPADCFGDTGAAVGALLISLAFNDLVAKGNKDRILVSCSSDQAPRAAICVGFDKIEKGDNHV